MTFQSAQNTKSRYAAQALKHIVVYTLLVAGIAGGGISASASTPTTTTLALTSGGNTVSTVASGSVVTLTATVKAGSTSVTVGQVKFCNATATYCEDSAVLGTAQLTAAGTATLNLRLGVGSHSIKALFAGTGTNATSTSASQSLTVTGKVWSSTALVATGVPGNYALTATVKGGGTVAPTGTVTFEDSNSANATVATATLDATTAVNTFLQTDYASGIWPKSVAVGDFNNDGKLDIVVANNSMSSNLDPHTVSVYLGNGDGTFQAKQDYAVGGSPTFVTVGDLNGDGKLDLVVAGGAVSVLLGNGDGTFQPQISYSLGTSYIAIGDFNGDGVLDLAASIGDSVCILLGNGDGTFQAQQTVATVPGANSLAMGDFNGDNRSDLVVMGDGGVITLLLGKGDGTFDAGTTAGTVTGGGTIEVADVNEDGKPDLVVFNGAVRVLLGNGDGTFQLLPYDPNMDGFSGYSFAVADLNGDGKPDLVVPNWYGETWVLFGNGDGTFQVATYPTTVWGWQAIAVGDFNGDGRPDIADTSINTDTTSVLLGGWTIQATASGVFVLGGPTIHSVFGVYGGDSNYASSNSSTVTLARGVFTSLTLTSSPSGSVQIGQTVQLTAALAPATYSGNTASGTISIYDNGVLIDAQAIGASGQVSFTTAALSAGSHSFTASYPGDNNFAPASSGDDVVWATSKTTTTLTVSANSVTTGTALVLTATVKDQNNATVAGGQIEFCDASAAYCEDAAIFGTAQLTAAGTASIKLQLGIGSHSIKAVFVGDSTDSTSASSAQTVTVSGEALTATWLAESGTAGNYTLTTTVAGYGSAVPSGTVTFEDTSNGNATIATATLNATTAFASFSESTYASGTSSRDVVSADLNGDGKPDLVVANRGDNTVSVLLGNGDGTFQKQVTYATGVQPGSVAVGDFNGDGKLDIVVSNYSDNTVSILLGSGDGTFQTQQTYATGAGPSVVAVGDFNGDGKQDLVVANYNDNTVSVLLGKGDGTFQAPVAFAAGGYPSFVAVGDFNGDGRLDIVVSDANDNTVSVLLGNGDGTFQTRQTYPVGSVPYSVAVADFNGDGKLDLAVADSGYNPNFTDNFPKYVSVLLGNGDGTFQAQQSYQVGNEPFSVAVADINGDGRLDLALANRLDNTVSTLLGNGDGTFQAQVVYATGSGPTSVVSADFNGDGRPDLAVADLNDNTVALLLNQENVQAVGSNVFVIGGSATHTVVAAYGGDSAHLPSTSSSVSLTAGVLTTTTLISSLNPAAQGASVTFTSTVSRPSGATGVPTGSVAFMDGSTALGNSQLDGTGKATYTTTSLTVGSHSITAVYSGDASDSASTSTALTEVVASPSFAVSGTPVTISPGATTGNTSTITVTPAGGFTGSVALIAALTSSPAGAQYPPTLSFGSTTPVSITSTTAGTATLTISTTAATSATLVYPNSRRPSWYAAGGAALACLLFFGIPVRRRSWRTMLGMLFLLVALGWGVLACGGGGSSGGGGGGGNPGTTAGTYTVTVTGTSGSLTQTATLTVTVN